MKMGDKMDLVTLALSKSYTNKEIQKAQMGVSTDSSLSKANTPADAKAVGDALAKKPNEARVEELITQALEGLPFAEEASF